MPAPARTSAGGSSVVHDVILWALAGVGAFGATVWAGAQLATLVSHQRALPVDFAAAVEAAFRLPSSAGQPATAWPTPAQELVPGPLVYWPCTLVAAIAVLAAGLVGHHLFAGPGPGTERRRRLGVDTRSRLARPRDLAPLVVSGPRPGRFIVGRVAGRLVATENRSSGSARARRARRGDRSAVCVVGPSRCGKTANVISGILEWQGPAILTSVKDELLEATLRRRSKLGEVKVFDPTRGHRQRLCSVVTAAGRSHPHRRGQGRSQLAGRPLRPVEREDEKFFGDLGTAFLASLFYLAASSGKTMGDVVRWVLTRDRPTAKASGKVAELVDRQLSGDDPLRREWARLALQGLQDAGSVAHSSSSTDLSSSSTTPVAYTCAAL